VTASGDLTFASQAVRSLKVASSLAADGRVTAGGAASVALTDVGSLTEVGGVLTAGQRLPKRGLAMVTARGCALLS
jgi:hypothetical protein